MPQPDLILASTSAYRRELLARLRLPFRVVPPAVDESQAEGELPASMARRLALAKAEAVAALHPQAWVIGSDQVASADGRSGIGKPGGHAAAVAQLRAASGREISFHTAVALVNRETGFTACETCETRVRFRNLDDATIERYLRLEPAYDCAGSARSEALGIALVERIASDDPSALVGLPMIAVCSLLERAGLPVLGDGWGDDR
jgi:septum formation protein